MKVFIGIPIVKKGVTKAGGRQMIKEINEYLSFHDSIYQEIQRRKKTTSKSVQNDSSEVLSQKRTILTEKKDPEYLLKQLKIELERSPEADKNKINRKILTLQSEIILRDAQKLLDSRDG
jgi:DNA repair exonuclease SbcCD nuclease subunit